MPTNPETLDVELARQTRNPAAWQAIVKSRTDLHGPLLSNPNIDRQTWLHLTGSVKRLKISVSDVKSACHPLGRMDEEMVNCLLDNETRTSVIANLFSYRPPTADQVATYPSIRKVLGSEKAARSWWRAWGMHMDHAALAPLDPETLTAVFRAARLLSVTLSDEEVLAELAKFDEWGSSYDAPTLHWLIHLRPHLVPHLTTAPAGVRMVVAGSTEIVRLSVDQQREVLGLNRCSARELDAAEREDGKFTWAAGAANPCLDVSLLPELVPYEASLTTGYTEIAAGRIRRWNWSISSFSEVTDPEQRSRLVKWAVRSNEKTRPSRVAAVLALPGLTQPELLTLHDHAHDHREGTAWEWTSPYGRPILERIGAQIEEGERDLSWFDTRPGDYPVVTVDEPQPLHPRTRELGRAQLARSQYMAPHVFHTIDADTGEDPAVWEVLLKLCESGNPPGNTIGELVTIARALCS